MTEAVSPAEMTTLVDAAALLARLSPQARLDVQAAALEAEKAAEKARYDEEIRERNERCANDPVFLARCAEVRRTEETEHRKKLDALKALARQSGPSDPRTQLVPDGMTLVGGPTARFVCRDCGAGIYGDVTLAGAFCLCEVCNARHLLRCDQCHAAKDIITTRCRDGNYRCASCMGDPKWVGKARAGQPLGSLLTAQQLENGRFR
jgi:hypothetical protein